MQVFKLFFKVARSKAGIGLLYLVVFLLICFPMVHSTQEQTSFRESSLSIFIQDEDQTEASRMLIEKLAEKNTIIQKDMDRRDIMDALYYETVDYSLVIRKGYSDLLADTSEQARSAELFDSFHMHDSYSVAMMEMALNEYVRSVRAWIAAGSSLPEALAKVAKTQPAEAKVEIVSDQKESASVRDYPESFSVYFRMLPYLFIAVMVNVLCPILRAMNQTEQRHRIECSSIPLTGRFSQIFIGSAILVIFIWLVFMIAGMPLYGGIYRGTNCWLAVLNSLILALVAAMFAIFLASFNPSATVVGMIAQAVGLGMSFLCGAFVPQSLLGDGVLTFAKILPVYWYERANDILSGAQSGGLNDVWICFGVEAGFLVLLILLTLLKASRHPGKKHS